MSKDLTVHSTFIIRHSAVRYSKDTLHPSDHCYTFSAHLDPAMPMKKIRLSLLTVLLLAGCQTAPYDEVGSLPFVEEVSPELAHFNPDSLLLINQYLQAIGIEMGELRRPPASAIAVVTLMDGAFLKVEYRTKNVECRRI